jgi:ubiquinone/menaquinone biosynthesis C-methylase UbiE
MKNRKGYKGMGMEGFIASWYADQTAKDLPEFRRLARAIGGLFPDGGDILEVAPGPGYLAVELARSGLLRVTGLDISRTFIEIAKRRASEEQVSVTFRLGDAAAIPFPPHSFDLVVCRAAFKNFADPHRALEEMHRVLRPGGRVLIIDLRRNASMTDISNYTDRLHVGRVNGWLMKLTFRTMLLKRAYLPEDIESLAAGTSFGTACHIEENEIGMEIVLEKERVEGAAGFHLPAVSQWG